MLRRSKVITNRQTEKYNQTNRKICSQSGIQVHKQKDEQTEKRKQKVFNIPLFFLKNL